MCTFLRCVLYTFKAIFAIMSEKGIVRLLKFWFKGFKVFRFGHNAVEYFVSCYG